MSRKVIVTISTPENKTDFAAGTVSAGMTVAISGGAAPQQTVVPDSDSTIVELDVPAGVYSITTQTIDPNGQPLGAAQTSAEFTVPDDPASIRLPVSISVTVQ